MQIVRLEIRTWQELDIDTKRPRTSISANKANVSLTLRGLFILGI